MKILIPLLVSAFCGFGLGFILSDVFRIPKYPVSKAIKSLGKRKNKQISRLEIWLGDFSNLIASKLRLNEYKRLQLKADLESADMYSGGIFHHFEFGKHIFRRLLFRLFDDVHRKRHAHLIIAFLEPLVRREPQIKPVEPVGKILSFLIIKQKQKFPVARICERFVDIHGMSDRGGGI